jgi:hypothetical protein
MCCTAGGAPSHRTTWHCCATTSRNVCHTGLEPRTKRSATHAFGPWLGTGYPQPFVHVLSNTYFAPLLFRNRRHAALVAALGPRPFRRLARYLLRPAAPVAADVDAFLLARHHGTLAAPDAPIDAPTDAPTDADAPADAPPRPLMGMHARTQDWMRVPLEAYWSCMLRRALKSSQGPGALTIGRPDPPWMLERAASKTTGPTTAFEHSGCAPRHRTTTRG